MELRVADGFFFLSFLPRWYLARQRASHDQQSANTAQNREIAFIKIPSISIASKSRFSLSTIAPYTRTLHNLCQSLFDSMRLQAQKKKQHVEMCTHRRRQRRRQRQQRQSDRIYVWNLT